MERRLEATRERIVRAAEQLVAGHGWAGVRVAAVAQAATVATGTVYRHFADKDALCAEVFRRAAGRELARVSAAAAAAGSTAGGCAAALRTFVERALRGRTLAYALLAEPAGPGIEVERLRFRAGYRGVFGEIVATGVAEGVIAPCDPELCAAVLVGAVGEAVVGPLAVARDGPGDDDRVDAIVAACLRALPWSLSRARGGRIGPRGRAGSATSEPEECPGCPGALEGRDDRDRGSRRASSVRDRFPGPCPSLPPARTPRLTRRGDDMTATHEVLNQPPPREGHDVYAEDVGLQEAVAREGAAWAEDELAAIGRLVGDPEWIERGRAANANRPELLTHDRFGHRIDAVRFHPAYHDLMEAGVARGLHAAPWVDSRPGAHVARAAKYIMWPQLDSGTLCPMTMTYAVIPSLRHQPDLAAAWEPLVTSETYDPSFQPAANKRGALFGMAMTEKQGGSDVRANTTRAAPVGGGGPGAEYRLTGHKWFCSAPMNDAFLVLAKIGDGATPSCFLVPRWRPDGERNAFRLQRLKDKLGDRSNASSELELEDTSGWLVGEPHRGVRVIMEMVAHTRLDCVSGAAGLMRQGIAEAAWHAVHRHAFGRRLADQPLMCNVLADLAIESEAATALALRLARAFDQGDGDAHEAGIRRLGTPVAKYWTCKRVSSHAVESLECLGGGGYVEESPMPRLVRQSPLGSIWEGSGNVQCLDVLRAMAREPDSVAAFVAELGAARGADKRFDAAEAALRDQLTRPEEALARRLVERMAVLLQASILLRGGAPAVADAFCASRVAGDAGLAFGTLPAGVDLDGILARALPR